MSNSLYFGSEDYKQLRKKELITKLVLIDKELELLSSDKEEILYELRKLNND